MTNDEIINLSKLLLSADAVERATAQMEDLSQQESLLAYFGSRLLHKGKYRLTSDNPETLDRSREVAALLGATVREIDGPDDLLFQLAGTPGLH